MLYITQGQLNSSVMFCSQDASMHCRYVVSCMWPGPSRLGLATQDQLLAHTRQKQEKNSHV